MPSDTVTLALNGEVFLSDFTAAVMQLQRLMVGLAEAESKAAKVEWKIEALEAGSAIVTLRGVPRNDDVAAVAPVVSAFEKVGRAVARGRPVPFGPKVQKSIEHLRGILNGRIQSIRFETQGFDAELYAKPSRKAVALPEETGASFGAVEGRIQSLSNRGSLRFTLYDAYDDHAVSCYLRAGCESVMRNAWGKMATVEGLVRRDPLSGRVSTVRDVTAENVQIVPSADTDDWREAIGCAPAIPGSISPEEAVRRGRDE